MYSYIKDYCLLELHIDAQLDIFVNAKWITEEQKQEIISSKIV